MRYCLSSLLLALLCTFSQPCFADDSAAKGFVLWAGTVAANSCVTGQCHGTFGRARYVHAPVADGDCLACHRVGDQPHPGGPPVGLVEAEPGLCLQCHENPAKGMAYPHSALEEGCSGCHSPHQGDLKKFVREAGGRLCLTCHDDVKQGKFVHGPVKADNCAMCHGVHGGNNEAMLNLPGKENCLACHAGIRKIMDSAVSQHEPVANGVCWDCHTPHSSNFMPFLQAYYPQEFYTPFAEENFALCFKCHDKDAFIYDRTSELTNFRNRYQNLHYFHVNRRQKGRVCKSCHGIHGANQEKLLLSQVPDFGKWGVPLTWSKTAEGATCTVGCHRPKSYDRLRKIKNR